MHLKRDNFTGRMFRRLWWPAMLSSLGWALSDMADAVVVGQRLGTVGLAAIGLILPVYMINCIFAHGFGIGGSVRYARLLGQGKPDEAVASFHGVLTMSLIFACATAVLGNLFMTPLLALLGTTIEDGALFYATRDYLRILVSSTPLFYLSNILNYYLRNDDSERLAGFGSVTGNLCDIAMNVLFVIVLDLGTRGAALSTALGQIITICIYLPGFFNRHTLSFALPKHSWIRSSISALCSGLATSIQYLYQMVFFLICNNLLLRLGGENAVAVFDVLQNTSYLILYLFEGTGNAMQPILSTYQGEHNHTGKKNAIRFGFISGLCAGGVLIAFVMLYPCGMCQLFGIAGTQTESLVHTALRLYAIAAPFAGINILLCNYHQACENERPSFVLETLRGAVLLIPLTFFCYRLGLNRFWLLFVLTESSSLAVFLLLHLSGRFRTTQWEPEHLFQRTVLSNAEDVVDVSHALEAFCEEHGATPRQQMIATMTVEEIGMAILKHGFCGNADGCIQFTAFLTDEGLLELHLRDDAITFNPFDMHTEKAGKDGSVDMDGVGVLFIRKRAQDFRYRRYQGFNSLVIRI